MSTPRIIYVVFDRYPAPKGAAVHIGAFARALGQAFAPVDLVTVADETGAFQSASASSPLPGVRHVPLPARGRDVIARALCYRSQIAGWWPETPVEVVHFRSIFEGYPLARYKSRVCRRMVFEVNGLPSVELKYHHPRAAEDRELMAKLIGQEQTCLEAADLVITVSDVTAAYLESRGVGRDRIRIIPNGVDLQVFPYPPPRAWDGNHPVRLLYSGTLASWQGVDRAIEATALLHREIPVSLTLVGPATRARRADLKTLARRLGVAEQITIADPMTQYELSRYYQMSDVALAPLLSNDRNIVQGCCPLKVLEAMASGPPLVASNLPVVAALAEDGREALLVRAGSARAVADGVLRLAREPGLALSLSRAARQRVERDYTWDRAGRELVEAYTSFFGMTRSNTRVSAAASTPE